MGKDLVNYDEKSDVLYIAVKEGIEEEFIEVAPGVNVELDGKGEVIGVEILNASRTLKSVIPPLYKRAVAAA